MSVLDRSSLEASPLADLHAIASELGLDGFRRLRKAELIDAILARQEGDGESEDEPAADEAKAESDVGDEPEPEPEREPSEAPARRRRRGGRGRSRPRPPGDSDGARGKSEARSEASEAEERSVEGVIELLGNGSGFVRVSPPDPSDDDVYVSAAQVRRCELVSGDRVAGPVRGPRRSERYPSLIRVDTINGVPADEVAEGTRYEDLPSAFPDERLALGSDDVTVRAVEWLTPFGKGSRVAIVGPSGSGKSETLQRIAAALAESAGEAGGFELAVVLAGVRPEEIAVWRAGPAPPASAVSFGASQDAQAQTIDNAVEQGRRMAARGANVVLLIDTLDALDPSAARRAIAAARNIVDGGSLTILGTARQPVGGESTTIALDFRLASARRYPALDLATSTVLHPERLVGDAGAEAIARAREEALG